MEVHHWTPQVFDVLTLDEIDEIWEGHVAIVEAANRAQERERGGR